MGGWREGTQTVGALSRPAGSLSAVTSPPALSPDRFIRTVAHIDTDKDYSDTAIVKLLFLFFFDLCFPPWWGDATSVASLTRAAQHKRASTDSCFFHYSNFTEWYWPLIDSAGVYLYIITFYYFCACLMCVALLCVVYCVMCIIGSGWMLWILWKCTVVLPMQKLMETNKLTMISCSLKQIKGVLKNRIYEIFKPWLLL